MSYKHVTGLETSDAMVWNSLVLLLLPLRLKAAAATGEKGHVTEKPMLELLVPELSTPQLLHHLHNLRLW